MEQRVKHNRAASPDRWSGRLKIPARPLIQRAARQVGKCRETSNTDCRREDLARRPAFIPDRKIPGGKKPKEPGFRSGRPRKAPSLNLTRSPNVALCLRHAYWVVALLIVDCLIGLVAVALHWRAEKRESESLF